MDYRDSMLSEVLDIRPTKVELVDKPIITKTTNDKGKEQYDFSARSNDILKYFHLPEPKRCNDTVLDDIYKISRRINRVARDNDEFFVILRAIERDAPDGIQDSYDRIKYVWRYIWRSGKSLRDVLKGRNVLNKDILLDEAKETGNWSRYLKSAQETEKKIRK